MQTILRGMHRTFIALISVWVASNAAHAFSLPKSSTQCIVTVADDWNSSRGSLRFYQKVSGTWQADGPAIEVRLGRDGLVWGKGLHPVPKGAVTKQEGDWKSPAGVFSIGGVWGYDKDIPRHALLPYRRITPHDLWVEDPKSPNYNRHLILDHPARSEWERKQQMRQDDPAHALKLFIAHNAEPDITPGAGSSIFFHIWRAGGSKPTAGCTTMAEPRLRDLIAKLNPTAGPLYVLLPKAEYERLRGPWKLP